MVTIISECFIKPKYEAKTSKNSPYYLSPNDLVFISLDQLQKGLLFSTKPEDVASFLNKLKHSISISLVHFYLLSGQLATETFPNEHACSIYIDRNKGLGARLVHARVDLAVNDLLSSTDVHPMVHNFFDLGEKGVNYDGHTRPLLCIQVTELIDGVFMGFTMNHSVGDGSSQMHYISTLSEIYLQLSDGNNNGCEISHVYDDRIRISRDPVYNPFFPDGYGPRIKLPYLEPKEFIKRFDPGSLRVRVFRFSFESLARLKVKANEECNDDGHHCISSFQALCAFMWRCITRARHLDSNQETKCSLAANTRSRFKPPFSQDCFGNYVNEAKSSSNVSELLGHNLGWAAALVHQSVVAQDDNRVRYVLNKYVEAPFAPQRTSTHPYSKASNILIGGSARFDMYSCEFGLGRASAALTGYSNKDDGKITAFSGREGRGSVELELCLRPEAMDALELDEEFMSFVSK